MSAGRRGERCDRSGNRRPQPGSDKEGSLRRGQLVFAVKCASCHGQDGTASGRQRRGRPEYVAGRFRRGLENGTARRRCGALIAHGIPGRQCRASARRFGRAIWTRAWVRALLRKRTSANRGPRAKEGCDFVREEPECRPRVDLRNASRARWSFCRREEGRWCLLSLWGTSVAVRKGIASPRRISHRLAGSDFAGIAARADETDARSGEGAALDTARAYARLVDPKG